MPSHLFVAAALLLCSTAGAAGLRDLPATPGSLDTLNPGTHRCGEWGDGVRCVRPGLATDRVAGLPVIEVALFYRRGNLVRAVFSVTEQHFDAAVMNLTAQLGEPEAGAEALKAGMGGIFVNHFRIWRESGRVWLFEQFFDRITNSGLWLLTDAEFDGLMGERERARVRGARDL